MQCTAQIIVYMNLLVTLNKSVLNWTQVKNPTARKLAHTVQAIWGGERSEEVDTFPKFNKYTRIR
jgi:hypothetical protein